MRKLLLTNVVDSTSLITVPTKRRKLRFDFTAKREISQHEMMKFCFNLNLIIPVAIRYFLS